MSVTFTSDNNAPDVNLANRNAGLALNHMELPAHELHGECPAGEFYTRALLLLTLPDNGTPDANITAGFIDCGHRANYWLDTANRLLALAHEATEVTWY